MSSKITHPNLLHTSLYPDLDTEIHMVFVLQKTQVQLSNSILGDLKIYSMCFFNGHFGSALFSFRNKNKLNKKKQGEGILTPYFCLIKEHIKDVTGLDC